VIQSPGYVLARGERAMVAMFGALLVLSVAAIGVTLA
jgi:hypothetical protein